MKKFTSTITRTFKNFLPLKQYFIRNRRQLALGLSSLLMVDFFQLMIPLVIKRAIDLLTVKTATSYILFQHGIIIMGLALMIALLRYVWRYFILGHSRKIEENLRNRMYRHIQTLSPSFYQKTKTGDLMARAINDINAVRMATGMGLVALTDGIVLGLAAIGFMMSLDIHLTIISLIPAPFIIIFTRILTKRMSSGFESVQRSFSDLTERIREIFAGARVIKAYDRETWAYQRVEEEGLNYVSENMGLAKTLGLFFPLMAIFTNAGLCVVIWLGGRLAILGNISTGDFVAFISYLNLLTWPIMAMGWVTNLIQRGSASMLRINRILEEVPEISDAPAAVDLSDIQGNIEFKGLNFKYPGQKDYALKDIRFSVSSGETLAVVGRVGSGKTTLLHSIPRLLNTPKGAVFVDGRDVCLATLKTLRINIALVTQEVFLFSDTIRNNIVFGKTEVSDGKLEEVLHVSDIYNDIQTFNKGLDTMLGERGLTLSGGQRQRLTIARALIVDPAILILDDALSMVDTRTEEKILNRILKLRSNRTNIIVSHRVSTINRANRIIMLEYGRLIEQGTHENLLKLGGKYTALYEKQLVAWELETGVK